MRILVGWDREEEVALLTQFLQLGDDDVFIATTAEELLCEADDDRWDVILLSVRFPDVQEGFRLFDLLIEMRPDRPIVGAAYPNEIFALARFISSGMRSYIYRDPAGDYIFLLRTTLETALLAVRAEREQRIAAILRKEIESVRRIQESIIPQDLSCPAGYRIAARYEPSQIQVLGGRKVILAGGDYYNVVRFSDQALLLLVGDASGHGMRACMSVLTMHAMMRMIHGSNGSSGERRVDLELDPSKFSELPADPAQTVQEVNRWLCTESVVSEDGGFITLLYGILRTDEHRLYWASAGHHAPLLQELTSDEFKSIGRRGEAGLPLGLLDNSVYETFVTDIPRNSRLLFYTDGLVEAFDHDRTPHIEFGLSGVESTLRRMNALPLDKALESLFQDSRAFTGGAGRHDDTSIVIVERT